jgi:predicted  nucleic acid-binding Zn-ribbon protein
MSDTPRTDEAQFGTGRVSVEFARTLKRELNAANVEIEEKRKDIVYLATEKAKLEERIKRLEEAGDALENDNYTSDNLEAWRKAKEAK